MRIRDPWWKNSDPASGMEKIRIRDPGWTKLGSGINIPDPQHCFLHSSVAGPYLSFLNCSAMRDIAAVASVATEDLTILLPGIEVDFIKSFLNESQADTSESNFGDREAPSSEQTANTRLSVIQSPPPPDLNNKFQCSVCEFRARSRGNLSQHMNSRHGKIRYKCGAAGCPFVTTTRINLARHRRTLHDGVRFNCDSCPYSASSRAKLNIHHRTAHEGLRFPCALCAFSGTARASLKRHMATRHEGVRIPCPDCTRDFSSAQHLKVHTESVHEGRRYRCEECTYVATTRGHLRAHLKGVHHLLLHPTDH